MNNLDFYTLQRTIQAELTAVNELQDQYRKLTGQNFINGQVIREPNYCDDCKHNQEDGNGFFCNCESSEFFEDRDPKWGCADHDEEDGG